MMMIIILIRMKILERWMRKGKRTHSSKRVLIREQNLVREHILAREQTSSLGERAREVGNGAKERHVKGQGYMCALWGRGIVCLPLFGVGCVCPFVGCQCADSKGLTVLALHPNTHRRARRCARAYT